MKAIFLIGYMGSGKTTVGKRLAQELQIPFVDLDAAIEEQESRTIAEIFQAEGEGFFRQLEAEELRRLGQQFAVISCGGGTPCFHENLGFMREQGHVFYLRVPNEQLVSRLADEAEHRPLVKSKTREELRAFIEAHVEQRSLFYEQAHCVIENLEVQRTVESVLSYLH